MRDPQVPFYGFDPYSNKQERGKTFSFLIVVAIGAALCQVGFIFLPWNTTEPLEYSVTPDNPSDATTVKYPESKYNPVFATIRGTTTPWVSLKSKTCLFADVVKEHPKEWLLKGCDSLCLVHLQQRCAEYKTIATCGLVAAALVGVSTVLVGLGSGVALYARRTTSRALALIWGVAVATSATGTIMYAIVTENSFARIAETSQYPTPSLGAGFFATITAIGLLAMITGAAFLGEVLFRANGKGSINESTMPLRPREPQAAFKQPYAFPPPPPKAMAYPYSQPSTPSHVRYVKLPPRPPQSY